MNNAATRSGSLPLSVRNKCQLPILAARALALEHVAAVGAVYAAKSQALHAVVADGEVFWSVAVEVLHSLPRHPLVVPLDRGVDIDDSGELGSEKDRWGAGRAVRRCSA